MKQNRLISEEDRELFRKAVGEVTPLRKPTKKPTLSPKIKKNLPQTFEENEVSFSLSSEFCEKNPPTEYKSDGVSPRLFRQFKKGAHTIEDRADLHGLTIKQAANVLKNFIVRARERGFRQVLVIHGKGNRSKIGVSSLKTQVLAWLSQSPDILCFAKAQPKHGGAGALYVWLRKGR